MFVKDIIEQASAVTGLCANDGPNGLYNAITDAVEILANKANWDPMQGYLDIRVPASTKSVILPRQVEYPIKININANPSFSRDKLYEFILNGPGNDMAEVSNSNWMDKGTVPVFKELTSPDTIQAISYLSGDDGKKITFVGLNEDGAEVSETLTLNHTSYPRTTTVFSQLISVGKDVTTLQVALVRSLDNENIALYEPNETNPQYRKIQLSVEAPALRILYRRATTKITSDNDYIPLHSKMALHLMMKALEFYKKGDVTQGAPIEEVAVKFIKEEQESLRNFSLIDATEKQSVLDLGYNNADSIIVGDVYDDACEIFGNIGRQAVFDKITESVEILNNKSIWDGLEGYVDLCVENSTITLPRYVEIPLAVNVGGRPRQFRNKWFEFHLNGTGSNCGASCGYVDLPGDVITLRDVSYSQQLTAVPDSTSDNGKEIRVYGYHDNKWIMTADGPDGALKDGFPIPIFTVQYGLDIPEVQSQSVDTITRIVKPVTNGFVRLTGYDTTRAIAVTLGYYFPDETEPNYSRMKVDCSSGWIRMRYRKRMLKVTSLTDPLHLKSKLAIMAIMRSMKLLLDGKVDEAEKMEQKGFQYLSEQQQSLHPSEGFSFQFNTATSMSPREYIS